MRTNSAGRSKVFEVGLLTGRGDDEILGNDW